MRNYDSNDLWGNLPFKSAEEVREILTAAGYKAEQIIYVLEAETPEEVDSRLSEIRKNLPRKAARITLINNEWCVADLEHFEQRMRNAFNHKDNFVRFQQLNGNFISVQRDHIVAVEEVTR